MDVQPLRGGANVIEHTDIDSTLDVNVKGPLYGCRAVVPHTLTAGGGSIVNISSVNGLVSEPFLTVYYASKGAGVMLTKGVAPDYVKQAPAAT
ncbi:SDR family NAD(P)-dependent oxidoreductase [Streptomyces sp. NPDC090798]|uniref:SDR family NAD(P)-dependent oxidoreductase n=1 Tax=Streptomyces sp. NPDC090798 TaxID=3365968 RepID=UPI003818FE53